MAEEEPLSPVARMFHAPGVNCSIIGTMGLKSNINVELFKHGLQHTLIKHPRFSSLMVIEDKKGGKKSWIPTLVDIENHIIAPDLNPNMDSPDRFVEDYISDLTTSSMDLSKPLWEFHLLNVKTSDANSVLVFRIHHSIGDGASLISLVLACSRKISDPTELPSIPKKNRSGSNHSNEFMIKWFFLYIWSVVTMIINTFVDVTLFMATVIFLKDTKTPLKGAPGVESNPKRIVHRTILLDDVKLVKNAMHMTINDVLLGMTQAGLSLYLNRRYGAGDGMKDKKVPKRLRFRAALWFNIRPSVGIQGMADMMEKSSKVKWGNKIAAILFPFTIALQDDPLNYVLQAKSTIDRKKHSLEAMFTFASTLAILKLFGSKVAASLAQRVVFNTTMTFSNVIGPQEEISLFGHPIAYIAPTVCGNTQALTIHVQSYAEKIIIVVAAEKDTIPDPHQLCDDLENSLKLIKEAVINRGHTYLNV